MTVPSKEIRKNQAKLNFRQTCIPFLCPQERRSDVQGICKTFSVSYPKSGAVKVHQSPLEYDTSSHYVLNNTPKRAITLWKFVQNEFARALISSKYNCSRNSWHASATPAHAASTWTQRDG